MTRLSVNINKVALIRNSRGANLPDLVKIARDCESFGAQGITVHPRPDERHVKFSDLPALKAVVKTEFNIEGYPNRHFVDAVKAVQAHQCTLVPDEPGQLTSDHGWDTLTRQDFLKDVIAELQGAGIRVSLFVDPDEKMLEGAKAAGADRVEFYTGPFAHDFQQDPQQAIAAYTRCAHFANDIQLGFNAGHDLNLDNLRFFKDRMPGLLEVSIGHALICDALYYGLHNTIQMYLRQLTD